MKNFKTQLNNNNPNEEFLVEGEQKTCLKTYNPFSCLQYIRIYPDEKTDFLKRV